MSKKKRKESKTDIARKFTIGTKMNDPHMLYRSSQLTYMRRSYGSHGQKQRYY